MQAENVAQTSEIKNLITQIHTEFHEFQHLQKEALHEKDVLLRNSLDAANAKIDELEEKLDNLKKAELKAKRIDQVGEKLEEVEPDLKEAWNTYIRKGKENLTLDQIKLMENNHHIKGYNTVVDSQGGYLVLPHLDTNITRVQNETSPIRQYSNVITISTDQYQKPQITDRATCRWTDDRDSPPIETKTNTFKRLNINVNGLEALVPITLRSLEDSIINVEQLLAEMTAEAFMLEENTNFVSGNGRAKPQGFLTYEAGRSWGKIEQFKSGDASELTYEGLVEFADALKPDYQARSVFMMNRTTVSKIRLLLDANGRPLYEPAFAANPAQIFGIPIVKAADMPTVAPGALAIAFADFKRAYTIVDRKGMTLLRDPYTSKGEVLFWTHKRVGGGIDNFEAIKLLKIAG